MIALTLENTSRVRSLASQNAFVIYLSPIHLLLVACFTHITFLGLNRRLVQLTKPTAPLEVKQCKNSSIFCFYCIFRKVLG